MPQDEIDVAAIGRRWAIDHGEDCEDWDDGDFVGYFYNEAPWESVLRVRWRSGSFAGIKHCRGLFLAYDEMDSFGPFGTYAEAEATLTRKDGWDEFVEYSASPLPGRKKC